MMPPKPFSNFPNYAATMGFDFDYNKDFNGLGDAYIAEFGSEAPETTGVNLCQELDIGYPVQGEADRFIPNTGVIWKITKS